MSICLGERAISPATGRMSVPGTRFPVGPLLRTIDELHDERARPEHLETVFRVSSARVLFAEYHVIQHDFPWLRDEALCTTHPHLLEGTPERRRAAICDLIDGWLLENAAFVSASQALQSKVNTPISTTGAPALAVRPARYGRALVIPLVNPIPGGARKQGNATGLLDLKGAGVGSGVVPRLGVHGNGLIDVAEALHDLSVQWIFDEIFRATRTQFQTVPTYGIIDLGFDARLDDGPPTPAGIQVRRAHRRPHLATELPIPGTPEERIKLTLELLLRSYGFTSTNNATALSIWEEGQELLARYGCRNLTISRHERDHVRRLLDGHPTPVRLEGVNVQLAREVSLDPVRAQLVDFGHYGVRSSFDEPLLNLARGRFLRWGTAIWPESRHFVQPHAQLKISEDLWDRHAGPLVPGAAGTAPASFESLLADDFRSGSLTGREVRCRLVALVEEAISHWPDRKQGAS